MITGSVRLDGAPASDKRVLVVSGDWQRLLGSVVTGRDGAFDVPVDERPVRVMVKLQGPEVGIVARDVDAPDAGAPLAIDVETSGGAFHRVTARLAGPAGQPQPPFVLVTLDPLQLDGVAPGFEKFANRRDQAVVEASFFDSQVRGGGFEVVAQAGRYRLRGSYVIKARPVVAGPTADVVVADVIDDDTGERLPGDARDGFELAVTRPLRLTLTLAPVEP